MIEYDYDIYLLNNYLYNNDCYYIKNIVQIKYKILLLISITIMNLEAKGEYRKHYQTLQKINIVLFGYNDLYKFCPFNIFYNNIIIIKI